MSTESDPRDRVGVYDEHGTLCLYAPAVHRALVDVGLIWREGERWRVDGSRVDLGEFPELALCDFCNAQPVTWDVRAEDFALQVPGLPPVRSTKNWLACEPCGACIAGGDRHGLQIRALRFVLAGLPAPYHQRACAAQLELLRAFWQHYRGITRYVTPYRVEP